MSLAARIVAAREAVEDGDRDYALAILLDLERELARPVARCRCECGRRFEWPGLLEAYRAGCAGRVAA